jgi:hypothetical protein
MPDSRRLAFDFKNQKQHLTARIGELAPELAALNEKE